MSNLLGIGTKVKFLRTPDAGTITAKLGDGMVMVELDGVDMEIPAFEEDLVRSEDFLAVQSIDFQKVKSSKIDLQKTVPTVKTDLAAAPVFSNVGFQLALVPNKKGQNETESFDLWLINDTANTLLVEFDWVLFEDILLTKDLLLKSHSSEKMGVVPFDDINDAPEVDISLKPVFTEGVGEATFKSLKIKPKQLVKNFSFLRSLGREAHVFPIIEKIGGDNNAANDLKNYTDQLVKSQKIKRQRERNDYGIFDPVPNVNEYAAFVPELDLHIEMLHENHRSLTNEEIVYYQMRAFEQFLDKAIRLNVMRVHIIHGIGKGVLKERISARLRRNEHIMTFKNEYHEKYGWGATEVWLR